MAAKIHVVGSVNLDLVVHCARLPVAGETVLGDAFAKHPGGKGANQALAARRLGADVDLVACVGANADAEAALSLLRADGVGLAHCRAVPDVATGVALIAVAANGENQIVVAPGANGALSIADLPERFDGALIGQLETPVSVTAAAMTRCSGLTCINLAPAADVPDALLSQADLIVVNETEGAFYGLDRLFAAGGLTALTLGARGAVLFRDGVECARATPPPVTPYDTTGAGDCFVAALTLALVEGQATNDALAFACEAAAAATLKAGAQPSFPTRSDLSRLSSGACE
ncbi:ribokinase [Hyphobacterium sp.]|jgi:ribokinase|uniref:ribokinase n=1 Tax=Hyphobacterium sp. TaxID=2004662 RepID=UPI003BACE67B